MHPLCFLALAPALVLVLLGCRTPNPAFLAISCPQSAVLFQAAEVTKFSLGATAQAPENAVLTAEIARPVLECDYDFLNGVTEVDISFPIRVQRGPAAGIGPTEQTVTYFVVVLDSSDVILSKETFQRVLDPGDENITVVTENVFGTTIRLAENTQPGAYQILIGFQLTPNELTYNLAQRDSRP